jgi:sec-independent protein translocase protein TatA
MLSGLENPLHLAIVLLVLFVVFGAKRLPEMGRSLGTGMREFKAGILGTKASEPPDAADSPSSLQPRLASDNPPPEAPDDRGY